MILQAISEKILEAYAKAQQDLLQELIRDALEQARDSLSPPPNEADHLRSPYLTVKEAAEFSRLAPSTIRRMLRKGRLPMQRFGRRVIIKREDVEKLMQRSSASPLQ